MSSLNDFGRIITEERKNKGMTQEELAAALNITPQAVSKWENGIGLPDVTLFPKIAKVLDIPIGVLFGTERSGELTFPKKFKELPYICSHDEAACYSDKPFDRKEGGLVTFTDGSTADLEKREVINKGTGDIRIVEFDECEKYHQDNAWGNGTSFEREFGKFESLSVSSSFGCTVTVHRGGRTGQVKASGSALFIAMIDVKCNGKILVVTIKSPQGNNRGQKDNKLDIFTGFDRGAALEIKINGSSDIICEPDFESMTFGINGSGDISAASTNRLEASINGPGDIDMANAGDATITINGSGDVECGSAKNSKLKINGSGDITVKKPMGDIDLRISGSGDVSCGEGEIDKLNVLISGSGDFDATGLTVREAEITVRGASDITIGRIKERSVEKIPKGASLKVLRRG